MTNKTNARQIIIFLLVAAIFVTTTAGIIVNFNFNDKNYTITVTDKERVFEPANNRSKYLVFGDDEDGNSLVFENTDNLFRGKFKTSNIQGELKEGHKYKITVVGHRVPLLSMYENIIKIEVEE